MVALLCICLSKEEYTKPNKYLYANNIHISRSHGSCLCLFAILIAPTNIMEQDESFILFHDFLLDWVHDGDLIKALHYFKVFGDHTHLPFWCVHDPIVGGFSVLRI